MEKWKINFIDWQRIWFGNAPVEFMLEVFCRTLIIYVILLFVVKAMGKRMSGQLSISEVAVMLSLGAIVSVPMQLPDRGLLQGVLAFFCAFCFLRGVNYLGERSEEAELLLQGRMCVLVKDGLMQVEEMHKSGISQEQLFAQLRKKKISNLGQVDRGYLEACGLFSVFVSKNPRTGLSVYPRSDEELRVSQRKANDKAVCLVCGTIVVGLGAKQDCANCHSHSWSKDVVISE
ncbi:MAG: DUF421 domain-containing protein [Arcticibacter sp.]